MKKFSSENRQQLIQDLKAQKLDLLIIGGGITGAGILLDAQARGMKAALVEMQDFASGTSSRSTKLVHGGLRYLKQLEIKLVAEVGKERAIVYENGPHVTRAEPMLLPLVKGGSIGSLGAFFGMKVYDLLANVKKEEQRKMLNKAETIAKEPLLKKEILNSGVSYFEYRTDDARLTIEVIKEAVERGGIALNYFKATEFIFADKKIVGIKAQDQLSSEVHEIFASKIVNATGPWVDHVDYINDSRSGKKLHLTKGVHIVIDHKKLPIKQALYFDTEDGRMVFAIPREGKTYVGTTDTTYEGTVDQPLITKEDSEYLVKAINYMFEGVAIKLSDIESGWAGLRPLIKQKGKGPTAISRKDEIFQSSTGLITIAGGKLTGYRKMAERVVDLVTAIFKIEGKNFTKCSTDKINISGGKVGGSLNFQKFLQEKITRGIQLGINAQEAQLLAHRYGSNIEIIFEIIKNSKTEAEKNNIPPILLAQLIYSLENEMTVSPSDFFVRRTGALYFNIALVKNFKVAVIDYLVKRLTWSEITKNMYALELDKLIDQAQSPS